MRNPALQSSVVLEILLDWTRILHTVWRMASESSRARLKLILEDRSIVIGEFTLKSGAKSNFYVDCRQTTLHAEGATLIGEIMHDLIRSKQAELGAELESVGGMTMGADPISVSVAVRSVLAGDEQPLNAFCVRKEAKEHGRGKQIEGPFEEGIKVVVIDDVITTGGSTLSAIEAVEAAGGVVQFVACLVDREEGGKENIEARGYQVVSAFVKSEFV